MFGSSHNRESLRYDPRNERLPFEQYGFGLLVIFQWQIKHHYSEFLVYTQIFGNLSPRISAPSIFLLPEISDWTVRTSELTVFGFSGNLSRKFPCHLPLFLKFRPIESTLNATGNCRNVGSNGKHPPPFPVKHLGDLAADCWCTLVQSHGTAER